MKKYRVRYRIVQPGNVTQPYYQVAQEDRKKLLNYLTACEHWITHPSLWPSDEIGEVLRTKCGETWGWNHKHQGNRVRDIIPGLKNKLKVGDLTRPQTEILQRLSYLMSHYCELFPHIEFTREL